MYLSGRSLRLRKAPRRSNPRRVLLLLALIVAGVIFLAQMERGAVQPLFVPTAMPTRLPQTYADEAEAHFSAGNLAAAIAAYDQATRADQKNLDYWVALARIQIYAGLYEDALEDAETAMMVAPNDAKSNAVYAWALDWNVARGCRCRTMAEAEAAALIAIQLDTNYAPAHAYYSEILNDSQKWSQGWTEAEAAVRLDPNSVDAHRAMGYANESVGDYQAAIESYLNALKLNPNLISLYISIGLNYNAMDDIQQAILYFGKANAIDPQNVEPYLHLSRAHYRNDELGTAVQYLERALELDPTNPDIHGRMGLILFKRRSYEGAEPELRLAVRGGIVDGEGTPLYEADGTPLHDYEGNPIESADGRELRVEPMPLAGPISLEYYYTYGNLLAFLERCGAGPYQAPQVLQEALGFAPDDPTVRASYEESMAICAGDLSVDEAIFGTATPPPSPAP